jgi:hypothetical protein
MFQFLVEKTFPEQKIDSSVNNKIIRTEPHVWTVHSQYEQI